MALLHRHRACLQNHCRILQTNNKNRYVSAFYHLFINLVLSTVEGAHKKHTPTILSVERCIREKCTRQEQTEMPRFPQSVLWPRMIESIVLGCNPELNLLQFRTGTCDSLGLHLFITTRCDWCTNVDGGLVNSQRCVTNQNVGILGDNNGIFVCFKGVFFERYGLFFGKTIIIAKSHTFQSYFPIISTARRIVVLSFSSEFYTPLQNLIDFLPIMILNMVLKAMHVSPAPKAGFLWEY